MEHLEKRTPLRTSALYYTILTMSLTVVAVALSVLAFFFGYDTEIGYYRTGAILPIVSSLFLAVSCLAFAVLTALRFRKKEIAYAKKASFPVQLTAGAVGAMALLHTVYAFKADHSVLGLILGIGTALYFLLFFSEKKLPALSFVGGICAILRLLLVLGASYKNLALPMNSPEKLLPHIACAAGMLFLVIELRALLSKPYSALWFFSAASLTLLGTAVSVSLLVANGAKIFYAPFSTSDLLFALLLLTMSLYAGVRLWTVSLCPLPKTEELSEPSDAVEETNAPEETEEPEEAEEAEEATESDKSLPSEDNDNQDQEQ